MSIYNTANYPESTIETFELLGSKIVSVLYNHVYEKAQALQSTGQSKSITDAYKLSMQLYLCHLVQEDLYRKSVKDFYTHFNRYRPVPLLSFALFVDNVTREFVPTDYWSGLNSTQKDTILHTVISDLYKTMADHMLKPQGLVRVIDGHNKRENIVFFQDLAHQVMCEMKESFYQKFTKSITGGSSNVSEKLRNDLQKSIAEKKKLVEMLRKASEEIKKLTSEKQKLEQEKAWLIERARLAESQRQQLERRVAPTPAPTPAVTPVAASVTPPFDPPIVPLVTTSVITPVITPVTPPVIDIEPVSYIPKELQTSEFDPYEEIEDVVEEEISVEDIREKAKRRRAARALEPDNLGF